MNDDQLQTFKRQRDTEIMHFATVGGAVVPIYNIGEVKRPLNFTPEALAGIYLGKITSWNDPELTNNNPGIDLPDNEIVVVHRSDSSVTSCIWSNYLAKVSQEWQRKVGVGLSVNWPVGIGGKGSENVPGLVSHIRNSIGYCELAKRWRRS
jgi:phosphate transport system substrate-binding protein